MNDLVRELLNVANKDIGYKVNVGDSQSLHELIAKVAELVAMECSNVARKTFENSGTATPEVLRVVRQAAFIIGHRIENKFEIKDGWASRAYNKDGNI